MKPHTEKPAFSTLFLIRSKSTTLFGLKEILKVYVLISASTFSIKSSVFNALLIELLHMLHVKPLACKETLLTWACVVTEKIIAIDNNIVFIVVCFTN